MKSKSYLYSICIIVLSVTTSACITQEMSNYVQQVVTLGQPENSGVVNEIRLRGEVVFSDTRMTPYMRQECNPVACGTEIVPGCAMGRCGVPVEQIKFCPVCTEVPDLQTNVTNTNIPITVTLRRNDGGSIDSNSIKAMYLGVQTTAAFSNAFDNPSSVPAELQSMILALNRADRTIIVVQAKGYRLIPNQNFINLQEDPRTSNFLNFDILVEPTQDTNDNISATGTPASIPNLNTSNMCTSTQGSAWSCS